MRTTARTRKLNATDTAGARIRVTAAGHQRTVPYPYESTEPHRHAASILAGELGYGEPPRELLIASHDRGFVFDLA